MQAFGSDFSMAGLATLEQRLCWETYCSSNGALSAVCTSPVHWGPVYSACPSIGMVDAMRSMQLCMLLHVLYCCAGTYDWSGALNMDPNPFVLWGITGSIPAAASPSRHRAVLALKGTHPTVTAYKLHSTAQPREMMTTGPHSQYSSSIQAPQPAAATTRCTFDVWHTGARRSVLETPHMLRRMSPRSGADTLPVQGRVSVREQWLDDGTSNIHSSPLGSSGVAALTAGASAAIDGEISATVPASPAQGVPEDRPTAAQPQSAALRPTLPATNGSMPQPMLIALITVAGLTACTCFVLLAAWRRHQRKQRRSSTSGNDATSLFETRGRYCARPYELRASGNTPREVGRSAWSDLSRNDVSHTEVQSLDYGETGSDCSLEGHRAILPSSCDSMTGNDADE
jgi:hypothetical protein